MKNITEGLPSKKQEANGLFEILYKKILSSHGNFLQYDLPYKKVDFLNYLTKNKNLLVHGSNYEVDELEPKQANCKSKKFGNLTAVYATRDPILPIFYAIKDKNKFQGVAISGSSDEKLDNEATEVNYEFEVETEMLKGNPWSQGVIYILPKDSFEQGTDDNGIPIDEWVSRKPVKPLAKLRISPEDFPYLGDIKPIHS